MNSIEDATFREMALRAIVAQRCQRAYLHDLRGGLQAMSSSFELLTRAAKSTPVKPDLVEKSTAFFKRASVEHERMLDRSLAEICGLAEDNAIHDLRELLMGVVRFLQNDSLSKGIVLDLLAEQPVPVEMNRSNLRLVILSIVTQGIDQSVRGTTIKIRADVNPKAGVEVMGITGGRQGAATDLLLPVYERLMSTDGAQIEATTSPDGSTGWKLRW